MKKRVYGFNERLGFSNGHADGDDTEFNFLRSRIPNFKGIRRANKTADMLGCDFSVERHGLWSLAFDLKRRTTDYTRVGPHFPDDLALETWSNTEAGKIGWTRDPSKTTDFVVWYWQDTRRFFIASFPILCCVFQRYWKQWREQYGFETQTSREGRRVWHSECVYVPRAVVQQAMNNWAGPTPTTTTPTIQPTTGAEGLTL